MGSTRSRVAVLVLVAVVAWPAASPAFAGEGFSGWLRDKLVRNSDFERYGLQLTPGWDKTPPERPLVVFVHGYNSAPERNEAFLAVLRESGMPCGAFAYPNDQALADSAHLLARELQDLARQHPNRKVALVTHSMGGLVARACVENPGLDPDNVGQLIMVAPPNEGSLLAYFAFGSDLWEHGWGRGGGPVDRLRSALADGNGEAAVDLRPGSKFLKQLERRGRNPEVRYTVLLGKGAVVRPEQMARARRLVGYTAKIPFVGRASRRLHGLMGDLEEVIRDKGDGVVAVKRGGLDGVPDTVVLDFGHLSVTGPPDDPAVREVHQVVLARLKRKGTSPAERRDAERNNTATM